MNSTARAASARAVVSVPSQGSRIFVVNQTELSNLILSVGKAFGRFGPKNRLELSTLKLPSETVDNANLILV